MVRKTYSALAIVAIAALSIVGCGSEDLTDLNDNWMKAENDLSAKITEVRSAQTEMMNQMQAVPAADMDSSKMQDRAMVDQMLQAHETQLAEVEAKFNELKAKREEGLKAGKRTDFEAAWTAADAEYKGLIAKIDEVSSQNGDIKNKIDGLKSAPAVKDSAAAATTPATKDTVAAATPDTVVVK